MAASPERFGVRRRIIFEMDKVEAFGYIAAQAARGEISFPTSVNAALRLQFALDDPNCHIEDAIKLVLSEPQLAARTVALANSAAFNRGGDPVTNARAAVMRIGYSSLQTLVASLVVRQFGARIEDPLLRAKAEQLWEHTANVAALSQVIARHVTFVNPDTAMFAAIVHEVGGFYLLSRAEEFPGLLGGDPEEWIEHGEAEVGRGVLLKLGVPQPVLASIEAMWDGMRVLPPETLGDTLMLANDLSPVASPLHQRPGATSHQAATTIDFATGEGTLAGILEESADEVRSLTDALL